MPGWAGSDRRDRLPANWQELRREVLKDPRCAWEFRPGQRCPELAVEVDHIRRGDDHSLSNLRGLCKAHHARKSGQEGAAAVKAKRQKIESRFRRSEAHPGSL